MNNLRNLQNLVREKGKSKDGTLDTQDVVNILLSYDGFFVISAITDLFNTPKDKATLLSVETSKGGEKMVCPVNVWSAVITWVQEALSQVQDRLVKR